MRHRPRSLCWSQMSEAQQFDALTISPPQRMEFPDSASAGHGRRSSLALAASSPISAPCRLSTSLLVIIPAGLKSNPFSFFVSDGPSPTIVDCSASSRRKASARMLRAVLTSLHEMYCNCYRSKMMDLQLRQPLSPGKALASGTDLSRGERSPVASD